MPDRVERWRPPRLRHTHTKERAHYTSADWRAKRERILIRDAYTCRDCGRVCSGPEAHVDHIIPLEDGGTDADTNLACRCRSCHGRKTRAEQRRKGLL
jgi:5-methylcytosine-specific restriction endonuclease McrA